MRISLGCGVTFRIFFVTFTCFTKKTQLLKFLPVYCLCEMKFLQALISLSIAGPSCAEEHLANLEMVKIFYAVYVTDISYQH